MKPITYLSDQLHNWAGMTDEEMKAQISDETISTLQKAVVFMRGEPGHAIIVTKENFVQIVREITVLPKTHPFDWLRDWATMTDEEMKAQISDETISTLQKAVEMLRDEAGPAITVSKENFARVVREMRPLVKEGSDLLGRAILEASKYRKENQPEKAKEAFQNFLQTCKSAFYRRIAESELKKQ